MRVLFTSDWQADYANLDTLQVVVDEIISLKEKLGFDVLVHCGDVKHAYNPVDVRVVNFILRAISKFKKAGLEVIVELGNHDRVGMHVDKANWFPILRRANAQAFDEPGVVARDGFEIRLLPFRNDTVLLHNESQELSKGADPEKSVLVFHAEISNCRFNVLSRSDAKVGIETLVPSRYLYCIGGHIHLPQRVAKNVYYVGSPFASEWGEANQKKGYLLLDFETKKLTRVLSKIPGWYDPQWPRYEETKPTSWEGAKVRIKVPILDVRRTSEQLQSVKAKAEKDYRGAEILVIPTFEEEVCQEGQIQTDWPDKKKIEAYTKTTLPRPLEPYRKKTVAYLIEQLEQAGGLIREGGELQFTDVSAKNFLSFERLDWKVGKGLYVVTGKNKDWNRSNGAGKTSWLQPIAVALFGSTFKGQKHDRWVRRGIEPKKSSWVSVTLLDNQDRKVVVTRGRKPKPELLLFVAGEPVDSGNRPDQTQKSIEQITGYTWETLSNAVYIDQSRAHLMLTGTETARKEFLARLQNLERFERAKKQVKDQKMGLEATVNDLQNAIELAEATVAGLNHTIAQTKAMRRPNSSPEVALLAAGNELAEAKRAMSEWNLLATRKRSTITTEVEKWDKAVETYLLARARVMGALSGYEERLESFKSLESECPTCEQPIDVKKIERQVKALEKLATIKKGTLGRLDKAIPKVKARRNEVRQNIEEWRDNPELESRLEAKLLAHRTAELEMEQAQKEDEMLEGLRTRKKQALAEIEKSKTRLSKIQKWLSVLDYAEEVFARSGLPAYLNAQLVPELNQSASEYAELFSQKEIQVRFQVDQEGQMDVQVVNAHGGEGVQDQSEGEMKMASLITSFAVRQAAPKTNLLILDEPGDGLDPVSAKQFARGIQQLKDKFCTIILVTHNPSILAELGEENQITIVKENGISRMDNG
jgi:DNA repair exonuclease SbcCD nuclease subunit/predicted ATPase